MRIEQQMTSSTGTKVVDHPAAHMYQSKRIVLNRAQMVAAHPHAVRPQWRPGKTGVSSAKRGHARHNQWDDQRMMSRPAPRRTHRYST
jgi:hypothetical protein